MPIAFLLWDHDSYGPWRLVVTLGTLLFLVAVILVGVYAMLLAPP